MVINFTNNLPIFTVQHFKLAKLFKNLLNFDKFHCKYLPMIQFLVFTVANASVLEHTLKPE